jgi:hypothetical protein
VVAFRKFEGSFHAGISLIHADIGIIIVAHFHEGRSFINSLFRIEKHPGGFSQSIVGKFAKNIKILIGIRNISR